MGVVRTVTVTVAGIDQTSSVVHCSLLVLLGGLAVRAGGILLEPFLAGFTGFDVNSDGVLLAHELAAGAGNGTGSGFLGRIWAGSRL